MRGPRSHRGYTRIFLSLGFALLGHRGSTRISTRLAKPALRSWVIADPLASPRGSQCFRISALSEGHRGSTRISPDLCECPPLAFALHCDPSQFRHFPIKRMHGYGVPGHATHGKNSRLRGPVTSHPCHSRVLTPSPILYGEPPLNVGDYSLRFRDPGEQANTAPYATRQDEQTENTGPTLTVDLYWSLAVCLTRERLRSVVV